MKLPRLAALLALALSCFAPASRAQAPDAHLASVLAELDAASQRFTTARADFVWDYYEAVVRDTTTQTGAIYFQRAAGGMQMGASVLNANKKQDKVLQYKDGILKYWDVTSNQVRNLKAGSNQGQYESFLTLGFGGSGKELARAWNIKDLGAENISDNGQPVSTEKLELISKDPNVLKMFTRVTIWVDPKRGVSLRQVFDTPSHDKRTATYSHIKLNGKIDADTFAISKKAVAVN